MQKESWWPKWIKGNPTFSWSKILLVRVGPGFLKIFWCWCGPKFLSFLSRSGTITGPERTAWSWYSRFWTADPWVECLRTRIRELQTQIQFLKISVLVDFVDFNEKNLVIHQSRRFKEIIHRIIRLNHPDESSDLFSRMKFLDSVVCFPHLVRSEHIWH